MLASLCAAAAAPCRAQPGQGKPAASAAASAAQQRPDPAADVQPLIDMLRVEPGASCLERARLAERIGRWLERDSVDATIHVDVRGDPQSATKVAFSVVRGDGEPTQRTLRNAPTDCDQLHSAVALSIALAVEAIVARDRTTGPIPRLPAAELPSVERRGHHEAMHLELGLLVGASVGVVPSTAAAALPRLQFSPLPWLSIGLAGIATRAERATVPETPGSFSATVIGGGIDLCVGGETAERLNFLMCAGARGGVFTTDAAGYYRNRSATRRYWALSASGQARAWILPAVGLGVSLEALYAVAKRELVIMASEAGEPTQTRSVPQLGLSIAIGPVFRFF